MDFLTNRPQAGLTSSTLVLNTGIPQGCVLSLLLFVPYVLQPLTWGEDDWEVHK